MPTRSPWAAAARRFPRLPRRIGDLRTRLAAAWLLFAVALAGAGALLARSLHDDAIRATERNLASLTTLVAEQAGEALQAIELAQGAVVDDFGGAGVQSDADFARFAGTLTVHDRLTAVAAALPQAEDILVADRSGRILNGARGWPGPDARLSDQKVFQALAADPARRQVILSTSGRTPDQGPGLLIAHRVADPLGHPLGFVLTAVNLRHFEKVYARVAPEVADVISMVHRDGTMLARHPCPPGALGRVVPPLPWLASSARGRPASGVGRIVTPIDGQDRIIAVQAMDRYPVIVGASRPTTAVLATWREQAALIAAAVTLLVGGLTGLLWAGAAQIRGQKRVAVAESARAAAEDRARADRRLRDDYARFGAALDRMSHGLGLFDRDGTLVVLNRAFAALNRVPEGLTRPGTPVEALVAHLAAAAGGVEGLRFAAALRVATAASDPSTLSCALPDGRTIAFSIVPDADGGFVCTCEDDTARQHAQALLTHMAHHDALTGLPNRLLLTEAVERLLSQPRSDAPGAVLLLDLDGFKQVNDTHGHAAGDALLRLVADRLRAVIGPRDLLARLGGDEFAIVHKGASDGAEALATGIVAAMQAPFAMAEAPVAIGVSIGVARPRPGMTPDQLLIRADAALYRAKAAGRGTWHAFEEAGAAEGVPTASGQRAA